MPVPAVASLELPPVRVSAPAALARLLSSAPADRAAHTYGKAFRDVVRALYGEMAAAPDLVARPRDERDVVDLLDWAAGAGVAVVPYGAGSSVVGGVEYRAGAIAGSCRWTCPGWTGSWRSTGSAAPRSSRRGRWGPAWSRSCGRTG